MTSTGFTIANPALNYLAGLPQKNRLELRSIGHFTDRYSPVPTIEGNRSRCHNPRGTTTSGATTPCRRRASAGRAEHRELARVHLPRGEWYLDPAAGRLYLPLANGENPTSLDLPVLRLDWLERHRRQLRRSGARHQVRRPAVHRNLLVRAPEATGAPTSRPAPTSAGPPTARPTPSELQQGCGEFEAARRAGTRCPRRYRFRPRRRLQPSPLARSSTSASRRSESATTLTRTRVAGTGRVQHGRVVATCVAAGAAEEAYRRRRGCRPTLTTPATRP